MRRIIVPVLLALTVLAGCGEPSADLFGADLYQQSCAGCHGAEGNGGTGMAIGPGSNAVGLTDEQMASVIVVGPGAMPGFPRLDEAQVASLVDYVRQLQAR